MRNRKFINRLNAWLKALHKYHNKSKDDIEKRRFYYIIEFLEKKKSILAVLKDIDKEEFTELLKQDAFVLFGFALMLLSICGNKKGYCFVKGLFNKIC